MTENKIEYVLGVSQYELDRLEFQHKVWKEVTDSFLDKIDVQKGWKILDVGAGPGFLSIEFLEKVGPRGEISVLEPSDVYIHHFQQICKERYLSNYRIFQTNVESSSLPKEYYDLIFARWVIAFVPDPGLFLDKLVSALKPGGIIAFMDYAYEGLALYPRGGAFENAAEAVKAYWRHGGGDPYIGAALPKMFKERKILLTEYQPVEMAGGPNSGVFKWADRFFSVHFHQMAEMGVISTHDADEMLKDWTQHRENPDSIFFSPIIVNAAGRKD